MAVVSHVGGLPEVVGKSGVTVPANDPDAWASALQRLEKEPQWRMELESHLPTIASRFAPDAMIGKYIDLYEKILAADKPPT